MVNQFNYIVPKSLGELIFLISEYKGKARLIAGGTDLIAKMKRGAVVSGVLINIQEVKEMNYIKYDFTNGLRIGALTPLAAIENASIIQNKFPVLSETASMMASPNVRLHATIGGNLCNAAPSADAAPALIALGANVQISRIGGNRVVPLEDFFTSPGKTLINEDEILTEIQVSNPPPLTGVAYFKQKRRTGADLAVVGVAALVTIDTNVYEPSDYYANRLYDVKIVLGAVAPTPIRAKEAENILKCNMPTKKNLEKAAQAAIGICKPISDARGSAEYRLKLIGVLVPRAIKQAMERVHLGVKGER